MSHPENLPNNNSSLILSPRLSAVLSPEHDGASPLALTESPKFGDVKYLQPLKEPGEVKEARKLVDVYPELFILEQEIWHDFAMERTYMQLQKLGKLPSSYARKPSAVHTVTLTFDDGILRPIPCVLTLADKHGKTFTIRKTSDASTGRVRFRVPLSLAPVSFHTYPIGVYGTKDESGAIPTNVRIQAINIDEDWPWWHELCAAGRKDAKRGEGVHIGVIDTGLGMHPCLKHVTADYWVSPNDEVKKAYRRDDLFGHGTHVIGTIASRSEPAFGSPGMPMVDGVAPYAEISSVDVFNPHTGQASNAAIARAIRFLITQLENPVDVINLSLGTSLKSDIVADAIQAATNVGVLCIAAGGNSGATSLAYPAFLKETVGVGAIGLTAQCLAGTNEHDCIPTEPSKQGANGEFLATFSNHGDGLNCVGPGVGVVSCLPVDNHNSAPFGPNSGTSMASPVVAGVAAVQLGRDATYQAMPRTSVRTDYARESLLNACRTLGMAKDFEGNGLANASP